MTLLALLVSVGRETYKSVQSTAWIFSFVLSAPLCTCLKEPVFSKAGSSAVEEGTSQTVPGFFDEMKVPASLSLFLKSEKNPSFYVRKMT
jgi:hypothetical protein